MGRLALATICPNNGAFLLVEIEQNGRDTGGNGQIHGNRGFSDAALLCDESYGLQGYNPSYVQSFRCAHLKSCRIASVMSMRIRN